MATLKAIAALGQSIVADIAEAKDSAVAAIQRARNEREAVKQFRTLLREEPLALAKAFKQISDAEAKPKQKRTRKAAQK